MDILLVAYCVGFPFAWVAAMIFIFDPWIDELKDVMMNGLWAFLVAIIWPIVLPLALFGYLMYPILKRTKSKWG